MGANLLIQQQHFSQVGVEYNILNIRVSWYSHVTREVILNNS